MKPLPIAAVFTALLLACPAAAEACPMCKAAAEADDRLPRAFFASILFMMGVPAVLFCGFGLAFWRLSKVADGWEPEDLAAGEPGASAPGAANGSLHSGG